MVQKPSDTNFPTKHIAAVILVKDGKILAAQRSYGMKDKWEFPGGKIEAGESAEEALRRECREELGCELGTLQYFDTVEHDYEEFHCTMELFIGICTPGSEPQMLEHEAFKWLGRDELMSLDWLGADIAPLKQLGLYWDEIFGDIHM